MLPPIRKRAKMGVQKAPRREWPRHRTFLRKHQCVVPGCTQEPIEVSHIRYGAHAGMAQKPHDALSVPKCRSHHAQYHNIGHKEFERRHGVNLSALAVEFTRKSPDREMRESLALVTVGDNPMVRG